MNFNYKVQLNKNLIDFQSVVDSFSTSGCAYLTPDALMMYCQTRLQGIDTQVNTEFAKQKQANFDSSVLSGMLSSAAFSVPSDKLTGSEADGKRQSVIDEINKAEGKLSAGDPLLDKLEELKATVSQMSGDLDPSTFNTTIAGGVQNLQKDINSSAELGMINLQSLMSQRQSAIQMCTNLVQSLGDQMNKIAQNIGH